MPHNTDGKITIGNSCIQHDYFRTGIYFKSCHNTACWIVCHTSWTVNKMISTIQQSGTGLVLFTFNILISSVFQHEFLIAGIQMRKTPEIVIGYSYATSRMGIRRIIQVCSTGIRNCILTPKIKKTHKILEYEDAPVNWRLDEVTQMVPRTLTSLVKITWHQVSCCWKSVFAKISKGQKGLRLQKVN